MESIVSSVSSFIAELTAAGREKDQERDFAGLIRKVTIAHPASVIPEGVVIVDTPGIAAESRHTAMTIRIVNEEADACLFLCPAEQAGTLTDLEFVKNYLVDNLGEIIFILTKADKAENPAELEELLSIVKGKVSAKTGIKSPRVVAVTAVRHDSADAQERFSHFITETLKFAANNRQTILARHLILVQQSVIASVEGNANRVAVEYEERLQELKKHIVTDLRSFVEKQQGGVREKLEQLFDRDQSYNLAIEDVRRRVASGMVELTRLIHSADSKQKLQKITEGVLRDAAYKLQTDIAQTLQWQAGRMNDHIKGIVTTAFAQFEKDFEQQYALKRLAIRLQVTHCANKDMKLGLDHDVHESFVSKAREEEAVTRGWSAGTGAVLGTILFPGIGTIVGGVLGSMAGALFGPSLDELKQSTISSLQNSFENIVSERYPDELKKLLDQKLQEAHDTLEGRIRDYLHAYEAEVRRRSDEHEKKKDEVALQLRQTHETISILRERKKQLRSLVG